MGLSKAADRFLLRRSSLLTHVQTGDDKTAVDNYWLVQGWLDRFPHYRRYRLVSFFRQPFMHTLTHENVPASYAYISPKNNRKKH